MSGRTAASFAMSGAQMMTAAEQVDISCYTDCQRACIALAARLTALAEARKYARQIDLLSVCAELCATQGQMVKRASSYDLPHSRICADACQVCAAVCLQFEDQVAEEYADACAECARSCRARYGFDALYLH